MLTSCAVLGLRLHGTLLPQLEFSRRERREARVIGYAWLQLDENPWRYCIFIARM